MFQKRMFALLFSVIQVLAGAQASGVSVFGPYLAHDPFLPAGLFSIYEGAVFAAEGDRLCHYTPGHKTCKTLKGIEGLEGNQVLLKERDHTRVNVYTHTLRLARSYILPAGAEPLTHTSNTTYFDGGDSILYDFQGKRHILEFDWTQAFEGVEEDQGRVLVYRWPRNEAGPTLVRHEATVWDMQSGKLLFTFAGEVLAKKDHQLYLLHVQDPEVAVSALDLSTGEERFHTQIPTQRCRTTDVLDRAFAFAFFYTEHMLVYLPGFCESRMVQVDLQTGDLTTQVLPATAPDFYEHFEPQVAQVLFDHFKNQLPGPPIHFLKDRYIVGKNYMFSLLTGKTVSFKGAEVLSLCPSEGPSRAPCALNVGIKQHYVYQITHDHQLMLFDVAAGPSPL